MEHPRKLHVETHKKTGGDIQIPTIIHVPYHPCMLYLATFTIKDQPNVGKYTIHGWYGCENTVGFRPCPPSSVEQAAQMREKDGLSQEKRWKKCWVPGLGSLI